MTANTIEPMLAHNVYFTLHDRSQPAIDKLIADCQRYLNVQPGIVFFACGALARDLDREVNDRDFDVALHIVFVDKAAHDVYQEDPEHQKFITENQATWAKVRVFDAIVHMQHES